MARPTIRDVAKRAGVSTATVSYVLNNTGSVSAETARRVQDCVDELGYKANSLAVAHRTGRSKAIGLAVQNLANPFFPEFAQGVHEAAAAEGFAVFLLEAHREGLESLSSWGPEGLIWCPSGPDTLCESELAFPTVVFDSEPQGLDSVNADLRRGGQLQAELLTKNGHRKIGIISGPQWSDSAQLRRTGLLEALPESAEVKWDFPLEYTSNIPLDVAEHILASDVTCVVTANDIQAIGLLRLYRDAGRSVPDDVSVIGFDDTELSELVTPGLTTVHLPTRDLGASAFNLLLERIRNPEGPVRHERLEVTMTERESLRRLD